ncbi:MAG: sulfatase family protein, partial [Thermoguttaceae bacterium]
MKRTLLLAAIVGLAGTSVAAGEDSRPNVLYIFTDQQHAGMMSCAGNRWLKTPAMDSLARTGARFERAYSVNPVCVPSRTGMLTGHTPSRFGMEDNSGVQTTRIPEPIQKQTLGWLFRNAGYETAYGGKTHVPGRIDDYGFEVLTGDQRDELAAQCSAFLKRPHDKPFLLVASFINPHDICYLAINDFERAQAGQTPRAKKDAPGQGRKAKANRPAEAQECLAEAMRKPDGISDEEFFAKLCPPAPANLEPQIGAPDALQGATLNGFRGHAFANWTVDQWRLHRWAYCRLTEQVDRQIGQVLEALRDAGLEEKTVIVFSSDHGDMDGSHRLEHKSVFFEEACRVPFLISYPGVTRPGLVDREHLVSAGLDLIPTLCDYAGIAAPPGLMGRSVRLLAEGRSPDRWRPFVAAETHYGRMVCSGRYKYCVYESGSRREQLVDLEADPGETRNLADDPAF